MPKGPNGQKRPADAIGLAVLIGKIATGEIEDRVLSLPQAAASAHAKKAAVARSAALTGTERSKIARKAAKARWDK